MRLNRSREIVTGSYGDFSFGYNDSIKRCCYNDDMVLYVDVV